MTIKIDKKGGNWLDLQQSEMCWKASMITWESIWRQVNMNHWTRRSIHQTLHHQIVFRQYNPKKPHHYGILFKSLNDARYPYTYKPVTYASKLKSRQGPYYIKSMIDYVKYRVTKTEKQQNLHGRNISTDRLYASVELSKWLLTRNITTVATV